MPRDGSFVLSHVRLPTLAVACGACGRYDVERLMAEHGDAKLTDLLVTLAGRALPASMTDARRHTASGCLKLESTEDRGSNPIALHPPRGGAMRPLVLPIAAFMLANAPAVFAQEDPSTAGIYPPVNWG